MEISGASVSHSQAPSSSSVIVQSQAKVEETGVAGIGDIQQQPQSSQQQQQHLHHSQHPHHLAGQPRSFAAQQAPSSSSTSSPVLSPPTRTVGKNYNGTSEYIIFR